MSARPALRDLEAVLRNLVVKEGAPRANTTSDPHSAQVVQHAGFTPPPASSRRSLTPHSPSILGSLTCLPLAHLTAVTTTTASEVEVIGAVGGGEVQASPGYDPRGKMRHEVVTPANYIAR